MAKLVEHLMRCAICGAVPKIRDIYECDPNEGHSYKLFCSECGVHNSIGEWFQSKYKACLDWNKRQKSIEEKAKTFGDNLKPCPFCGRKMQFHNDQWIDRNGDRRRSMYFMHKDYNPHEEESCILDDICMPFAIGAGDADVEIGDIGEYAMEWNERRYDDNPIAEVNWTLLKAIELLQQKNEKLKRMLKMTAD